MFRFDNISLDQILFTQESLLMLFQNLSVLTPHRSLTEVESEPRLTGGQALDSLTIYFSDL